MQDRVYSTWPNRATILEERALQAGDLTDPLLARFDALWREKCGEGWLPGVDAFDPAEIVDLLPHINAGRHHPRRGSAPHRHPARRAASCGSVRPRHCGKSLPL